MSEQKRETKDELISRFASYIDMDSDGHKIATMEVIYDEIRDHILTPKIKELLKVIGSKPETCCLCNFFGMKSIGSLFKCRLKHSKKYTRVLEYGIEYLKCPLLTVEELKEVLDE